MTKRLDPELKRRRGILTRMAMAGRLGDYLSTLTSAECDEAYEVLEGMRRDYERRSHKAK